MKTISKSIRTLALAGPLACGLALGAAASARLAQAGQVEVTPRRFKYVVDPGKPSYRRPGKQAVYFCDKGKVYATEYGDPGQSGQEVAETLLAENKYKHLTQGRGAYEIRGSIFVAGTPAEAVEQAASPNILNFMPSQQVERIHVIRPAEEGAPALIALEGGARALRFSAGERLALDGGEARWVSYAGAESGSTRRPARLLDARELPGHGLVVSLLDDQAGVIWLEQERLLAAALRSEPAGASRRGGSRRLMLGGGVEVAAEGELRYISFENNGGGIGRIAARIVALARDSAGQPVLVVETSEAKLKLLARGQWSGIRPSQAAQRFFEQSAARTEPRAFGELAVLGARLLEGAERLSAAGERGAAGTLTEWYRRGMPAGLAWALAASRQGDSGALAAAGMDSDTRRALLAASLLPSVQAGAERALDGYGAVAAFPGAPAAGSPARESFERAILRKLQPLPPPAKYLGIALVFGPLDLSANAKAFRAYAKVGEEPAFAAAGVTPKRAASRKLARKYVGRVAEKGVYVDAIFDVVDEAGGEHKLARVQHADGYWWNVLGFGDPARASEHNVYLAVPAAKIGRELPFLLRLLSTDPRLAGAASGIRFPADAAQLERADRLCVSFSDAGAALDFAARMEQRLAHAGYPPGRPGFAGSEGWAHVGVAHDSAKSTHAESVARAIAEASASCRPPDRECVCKAFVKVGIHPDTLMPVGAGYREYECP